MICQYEKFAKMEINNANVDECGGMEDEIWAKHRTAAMAQGDKQFHKYQTLAVFAKCIYRECFVLVKLFVTLRHCGCSVLGPDLILYACKLINIPHIFITRNVEKLNT